jgi:hypothetical protein
VVPLLLSSTPPLPAPFLMRAHATLAVLAIPFSAGSMPVSVGANSITNARSPSSGPVGLAVVSNPEAFQECSDAM